MLRYMFFKRSLTAVWRMDWREAGLGMNRPVRKTL